MSEEITTLLPPGTWVQQGPATLVVREAGWAVMVPGLKKNVIEAAWVVLGKAPQAEEFLDLLVAESELESADKLTAILFGLVDGTTVTYGVKGKTPISVYTADGAQQIAGTDEEPFVIKKVEGVRRTAFGELPAEDPEGLPRVSVGVTRARGFVHVTVDPAELDEEARKALAEQVEADGRSIEDPEAKQRKKDKPPPAPRPKPGSAPARKPMLATRKPGEMPPSLQGRSRGASSSSARTEEPAEPAGPSVFDDLFGDKPAASAAAAEPAPAPAPAAEPAPAPAPAAESTPEPAAAAEPAPAAAPAEEPTPAPAAEPAPAAAPDPAPAPAPGDEAAAPEPSAAPASRPPAEAEAPAAPAPSTAEDEPAPAPTAASTPAPGAAPTAAPEAASAPAPETVSAPEAAPAPAPEPASAPVAAPAPEAASSSAADAAPAPEVAPAADAPPSAAPAEAATPPAPAAPVPGAAAAAATADDPGTPKSDAPPTGRRRLVSTSLFDRRRASRTAPAENAAGPASTATHRADAAPQSADPAAQSDDSAAQSTDPAAPAPAPESAPAPAVPAPQAQPSIPTPAPPEEDDQSSPETLVAPIDDGEQETEAAGPASGSLSEVHQGVVSSSTAITATAGSSVIGDLEASGDYDDLFGKTVFRRIEDAAVRKKEDGEEDPSAEDSTPVEETSVPEPEPEDEPEDDQQGPAAFAAPAPSATASVGEFIDWVPGVGREAPEIAQTAARRAAAPPPAAPAAYPQVHMPERPPAPATGEPPVPASPPTAHPAPNGNPAPAQQPPASPQQPPAFPQQPSAYPQHHPAQAPHPGMPMSPGTAGQAPAGRHAHTPHPVGPAAPPQMPPPHHAQGPAPDGPPAPPAAGAAGNRPGSAVMIPALLCPQGHANSPEHSQCRSCGAPLGGQTFTVPRPTLGIVDISTGETIALDRSAIIGRRPRASRVSGDDVPRLVTVPSPQQDISRSHLELQLEGWHVVAMDLGTTNGTTLYRDGMEPLRLRPREGVVLHRGDQLDLGDGIRLRMREAQ